MCTITPTIVIVDDNVSSIRFVETLIRRSYTKVNFVSATSYREARALIAKTKNIAIVILDHDLRSERTGSDLANELRSGGRRFGIILMSASTEIDKHYIYIEKPIREVELKSAVANWIGMFSMRKDLKAVSGSIGRIMQAKKIAEREVYGYSRAN